MVSPTGLASEEIAEDYKNALEDLVINSKWEIHNLTNIARENAAHALAISRVIENHILKANADRKLPAMFVLDSVVKNIGYPYTLFLGRNLYKTFMETYSLVNDPIRRKLDELLKTWKEPVPGQSNLQPVFQPDVTRPIENALIRWRTMNIQRQQQDSKSQQAILRGGRPTPPQQNGRYQTPPTPGYPLQPTYNGHPQQPLSPYPAYSPYPPPQNVPTIPQATLSHSSQPQFTHRPPYQHQPQPSPTSDLLYRDISDLIHRYKTSFANNPNDPQARNTLHALLQLQTMLQSHRLQPEELEAVKAQVAQLAIVPPTPNSSSYPYPLPPAASPYPAQSNPSAYLPPPTPTYYSPPPAAPAPLPPTQQPQPDLSSLFNSSNLANLLASVKAQQPSATPSVPSAAMPHTLTQYSQPPSTAGFAAIEQPNSLIASLRAAGVLLPEGGPAAAGVQPPAAAPTYSSVQAPNAISNYPIAPPTKSSASAPNNDVELTSASLKIPRPYLVRSLFEAFPNQCSICGKRYLSTPEGKKKKERHLDWHFRIGMKREEAAKRGQSRSWYVSELEWIKWREITEEGEDAVPNGAKASQAQAAAAAEAAQKDPKNKFILVPSDHALANAPCPICQEPFEKSYDDSISDWVWKDAVKIGTRVYHASEYAELKSDGGHTPNRTSTPDSVLGKRGREGVENIPNSKTLKVA